MSLSPHSMQTQRVISHYNHLIDVWQCVYFYISVLVAQLLYALADLS